MINLSKNICNKMMRIFFNFFVCILLVSCAAEGTKTHPYIIKSVADLKNIQSQQSEDSYPQQSSKWYRLEADLNLSGQNWNPIELEGNFDGNGHTISNLSIDSDQDYVGLFSVVDSIFNLS